MMTTPPSSKTVKPKVQIRGKFLFNEAEFLKSNYKECELTIHTLWSINKWSVGFPKKQRVLCLALDRPAGDVTTSWFNNLMKAVTCERRKLKGQ